MRTQISSRRLFTVLFLLAWLTVPAAYGQPQGDKRPLESPDQLKVERVNESTVRVTWRDRSSDETHFLVQRRGPDTVDWLDVATPPINREETIVPVGEENPSTYRVRAEDDFHNRFSDWSREVDFTPLVLPVPPCGGVPDLCLHDNRFRVRVDWRVPGTDAFGRGVARRFTFSDDSGIFWFFEPANLELAVKVLDARVFNGFFWVFHGGLSHVEYWITVIDTLADTSQTFHKFPGTLCGGGNTEAFPVGGLPPGPPIPPGGMGGASTHAIPLDFSDPLGVAVDAGFACIPSDTALCLADGRFRVGVQWSDPRSATSGSGMAQVGTNDSGFFWFFAPDNVELVTKIIDGRAVNGRFWFFYGGLSDVAYTITVTDTASGATRVYNNPAGNICGQADTFAF